jgi:hypothetical protein
MRSRVLKKPECKALEKRDPPVAGARRHIRRILRSEE